MRAPVITEESGLKIWQTASLVAYLIHGSAVHAAFDCHPLMPDVSPGSLKATDVYDGGRYRKTLVFRVPDVSRSVYDRFLSLVRTYIIAVYTDERGVERVMGSPRWPAFMSLERSGGSLNIKIEAWGDTPNFEFIKTLP